MTYGRAHSCPLCPGGVCMEIPKRLTLSTADQTCVVVGDVYIGGVFQFADGDRVTPLVADEIERLGGVVQRPAENKAIVPELPRIMTPAELLAITKPDTEDKGHVGNDDGNDPGNNG